LIERPFAISLDSYDNRAFDRGRPKWIEALWIIAQYLFISSALPGSTHRRLLLRLFGARIGKSVEIKPRVRVKFPWRLSIGANSWIGEAVWIDNLANVEIGTHCCISQGAYLCTGSHDWTQPRFDLIVRPIHIGDQSWIAARSVIGPGVIAGEGVVLSIASVATHDLAPWSIYSGSPATLTKARRIAPANIALTSSQSRDSETPQ
jgi:putative colanic acid biosynthesis acetyltransferase WcaF